MRLEIVNVKPFPQHVFEGKVDLQEHPSKSKFHETIEKIKIAFSRHKDKIWAIPKEAGRFAISVLSIIAAGDVAGSVTDVPSTFVNAAQNVHRGIAGLGIVAFVSMFENLINIPFKLSTAVANANVGDKEGLVLQTLDAVGSATEVVYNLSLGLSALTALGIPFIAGFSVLVIPIAIIVVSYGTVKGIYDNVQRFRFVYSIPRRISEHENEIQILKDFIDKKLDVKTVGSEVIFSAKKMSIISRRSDEKIVELMKQLRMHLDSGKVDIKKINDTLKHMKWFVQGKIMLGVVSILANLTMLVTLIASVILPGLSFVPISIVGASKNGISYVVLGLDTALSQWHQRRAPVFNVVRT